MTRITAQVDGAGLLARRLTRLSGEIADVLQETRRDLLQRAAPITASLVPLGPGPRPDAAHRSDRLPHVRDTVAIGRAGVIARHPAATLLEHGGTIAPRGTPIRMPKVAMGARTVPRVLPDAERALRAQLQQLISAATRG